MQDATSTPSEKYLVISKYGDPDFDAAWTNDCTFSLEEAEENRRDSAYEIAREYDDISEAEALEFLKIVPAAEIEAPVLYALLRAQVGSTTVTATTGTNGNGGAATEIAELLERDDLAEYQQIPVAADELASHIEDSGLTISGDTEWTAWEREGSNGEYLDGSRSVIYIWR